MSYSLSPTPYDSLACKGVSDPIYGRLSKQLSAWRVEFLIDSYYDVEPPNTATAGSAWLERMHTIMVRSASQPKIAFSISPSPVIHYSACLYRMPYMSWGVRAVPPHLQVRTYVCTLQCDHIGDGYTASGTKDSVSCVRDFGPREMNDRRRRRPRESTARSRDPGP